MPIGTTKFGVIQVDGIIGGAGASVPASTGTTFYVSSALGSDGNDGLSPTYPLATIDAAINKATADRGDIIMVMENHAETIANATALVPDVAGIRIIGMGEGRNRPTLTFSATGSRIDIGAADIRLSNLVFIAGISAVVKAIDVNADDFTLDGCEFNFSTTAFDFAIMVDVDAYDRATITNCKFIAEETAGSNQAIRLDDTHHTVIESCFFTGDYTNAAIYSASGDAAGNGLLIKDCVGYNSDNTAGYGIRLACAFTGTLVNNRFGTAYASNEDATFDPGSCACIQNYVSGPVDKSAVLVPYSPALGGWRVTRKLRTAFNGTTDGRGTANDTGGLFTVLGAVEGFVFGVIATAPTSTTANYATLRVGVVGNDASLIGRVNATSLAVNDIWVATGSTTKVALVAAHPRIIYGGSSGVRIVDSTGGTAVTAGGIHYHIYWRPMEPGANVVAV